VRRFPRREAEVAELARRIVAGLIENSDDFPSPPIPPEELEKTLDAYVAAHNETVEARAALAEAVSVKDERLNTLVRDMKLQLSYAEHAVGFNNSRLKALGWRKRKEPSPMLPPGPARQLDVKREGPGWVSLVWKKPSEGGPVAYYQVKVRHQGKSEWRDDARCFETALKLKGQERGVTLEYCVVTVNKAGEGMESSLVTALL
jgi:hypothetical protein